MRSSKLSSTAVWWVKRDLRLFDNAVLSRAIFECDTVVPLFVFEPLVLAGPDWSSVHTQLVHQGVTALRKNLEHHGSTLIVRHAPILESLKELHERTGFTTLYAHKETGLGHTYARDIAVAQWCTEHDVDFIEVPCNGVRRGGNNRDTWAAHFRHAMDEPVLPVPRERLRAKMPTGIPKGRTPALAALGARKNPQLPELSERAAHETLQHFLKRRAVHYRGGISSMKTAPTACSRLSVHLAWGTLSLKVALRETERRQRALTADPPANATQWKRSLRNFSSRLYWHAHFIQKLEDEVEMETQTVNPVFKNVLPVVEGEELTRRLTAWHTGTTGFPAIDAAMRYYVRTGWLNFRSRAMVTSFAVHALRIPWEVIVYELAQLMVDYVPGIHVSQVQMQAGVTGTNTIRVYSPMKQQLEQDPACVFIKANVPELQSFTPEDIADFQNRSLGAYPEPIIDFKAETKLMKDTLYGVKKSTAGRLAARQVYQKHGSRKRRTTPRQSLSE